MYLCPTRAETRSGTGAFHEVLGAMARDKAGVHGKLRSLAEKGESTGWPGQIRRGRRGGERARPETAPGRLFRCGDAVCAGGCHDLPFAHMYQGGISSSLHELPCGDRRAVTRVLGSVAGEFDWKVRERGRPALPRSESL